MPSQTNRRPVPASTRAARNAAEVMTLLELLSRKPLTTTQYVARARADIKELLAKPEHIDNRSMQAASLRVYSLLDSIEKNYPPSFQLCGARQAKLDDMLALVGATLEDVFKKSFSDG